jgi:hypothetical protein
MLILCTLLKTVIKSRSNGWGPLLIWLLNINQHVVPSMIGKSGMMQRTMGLVEALYLAAKSFTNNMGLVEALYLVTNLRVSCFILCLLADLFPTSGLVLLFSVGSYLEDFHHSGI